MGLKELNKSFQQYGKHIGDGTYLELNTRHIRINDGSAEIFSSIIMAAFSLFSFAFFQNKYLLLNNLRFDWISTIVLGNRQFGYLNLTCDSPDFNVVCKFPHILEAVFIICHKIIHWTCLILNFIQFNYSKARRPK